jgi:hypothetical protein
MSRLRQSDGLLGGLSRWTAKLGAEPEPRPDEYLGGALGASAGWLRSLVGAVAAYVKKVWRGPVTYPFAVSLELWSFPEEWSGPGSNRRPPACKALRGRYQRAQPVATRRIQLISAYDVSCAFVRHRQLPRHTEQVQLMREWPLDGLQYLMPHTHDPEFILVGFLTRCGRHSVSPCWQWTPGCGRNEAIRRMPARSSRA